MHDVTENSYIFLPAGCVSERSGSCLVGCCIGAVTQAGRRTSRRASKRGKNQAEKRASVSKVFKRTTHYNSLGMTKKDLNCFDDSDAYGEYYSLDLELWEELNYSIDEHKRINVSRMHAGKEVRLFIQTGETGEFKIIDNIIMFSRAGWSELRRVRGENRGQPLEVNANGTIWLGDRAEQGKIKLFTRRG